MLGRNQRMSIMGEWLSVVGVLQKDIRSGHWRQDCESKLRRKLENLKCVNIFYIENWYWNLIFENSNWGKDNIWKLKGIYLILKIDIWGIYLINWYLKIQIEEKTLFERNIFDIENWYLKIQIEGKTIFENWKCRNIFDIENWYWKLIFESQNWGKDNIWKLKV